MNDAQKKDSHSWLKNGGTDSSEIADQYDRWAERYDDDLRKWEYRAPAEAAALLKTSVPTSGTILDVGCGTGLTGRALKDCGYTDICGVDISEKSLRLARQTASYKTLQRHDLQRQPLPFADTSFDAINCVGVMTYIKDPRALFKEFCRIVRVGGHIVFTHRQDLIEKQDFPEILKKMEQESYWQNLTCTEPQLYLPRNQDYADTIKIVYYLFQTARK